MAAEGRGRSTVAGGHGRKVGQAALIGAFLLLLSLAPLALPACAQGSAGTLLWTYTAGGNIDGIAMVPDASLTAAISDDTKIYAFSGPGKLLWATPLGARLTSVAVS
ncbi:MAG TPA: hypothetical protein VEI51_03240, partial [Methanomicrobiales archaeon]|nr:hypothetical protein [Methanomicrobiales archaeon]